MTKKLGSAALKAVKLDLKALKAVKLGVFKLAGCLESLDFDQKAGFCCLKSSKKLGSAGLKALILAKIELGLA